jgi:PAS domain S-box-containing protein
MQSERIHILVVDDRAENVMAIKGILNDVDYEIVTAQSGAEALKKLLKQDFALILLDVLMPSMDGFETARLISQRDASRRIPIIFLTAVGADVASIYKGYALGAVDYLVKPIEPDIVRAKVAVFAELYRKSRQIQRQEEALRRAERAQSDLALKEREAEYEATFETAALGIAHVGINGRFLRVNRSFGVLAGYSQDAFAELELKALLYPDDASRHVQGLRRLLDGEVPSFRDEVRLTHRTGRLVWAELTVSLLRDNEGKPKRFITLAEDITIRKKSEIGQRALANASETLLGSLEFDGALRGIAQSVVPALADLCVVEVINPGSAVPLIAGASAHPDAARAKSLAASLQQPPEGVDWGYSRVRDTNDALLVEVVSDEHLKEWARTPNARSFLRGMAPVSLLVVPLRVRGEVRGAITLLSLSPERHFGASDVAIAEELARRAALGIENARLYKEAQDAIGARDEFLSIASHELRTPLTPLQIQLQRLLGLRGDDPLAHIPRDQLRAILRRSSLQVGRLASLIDSLLDVSRIGSERLVLEPGSADLAELAKDVVGRFLEASRGAGSALSVTAELPVLGYFDSLRMEQILTNLVSNAIKYGNQKPVEVSVSRVGDVGVLVVTDQGIGIAEEKIPVIFERFERGGSARSYGGLGLGLYIARRLVEAHGGEIHVESDIGRGSTFTVKIPLQLERLGDLPNTEEPPRAAVPAHLPHKGGSKTVLLVEDDPEIRECIEDLLRGEGYEVVSASNGQEALHRLNAPQSPTEPDVIVLDLMMPVMDGARFRDEQRKNPLLAHIPVLVVSGDGTSSDKAAAMDAAGCLKKPVDIDELLRMVGRVCSGSLPAPPMPS